MNKLNDETLKLLSTAKSNHNDLVSIYLQADPHHSEVIVAHYKNALKALRQKNIDLSRYPSLTSREFADNPRFWSAQQYGVAMFHRPSDQNESLSSGESFVACSLSFLPPQFIEMGDNFFVGPALLRHSDDKPFYVVALSLNGARVFQMSLFEIEEIEVDGIDAPLFEQLNVDEISTTLQGHTSGRQAKGNRTVQQTKFHGQGGSQGSLKSLLVDQYIRTVTQKIKSHLERPHQPVIFAGTSQLFPLFKLHSQLKQPLVETYAECNLDHANLAEISEKLRPVLEYELNGAVIRSSEAIDAWRGSSLFENRLLQVARAAASGQVERLIVNVSRFQLAYEQMQPELFHYETALRETFLHRGDIVSDFDPYAEAVIAKLRFPMEESVSAPLPYGGRLKDVRPGTTA